MGGTQDNPNTLDNEAGVMVLHAFLALYDATGSLQWLDAAAGAATFTETWMYAWNFAIRDAPPQYAFAGMQGQGLTATGHSATDVYRTGPRTPLGARQRCRVPNWMQECARRRCWRNGRRMHGSGQADDFIRSDRCQHRLLAN